MLAKVEEILSKERFAKVKKAAIELSDQYRRKKFSLKHKDHAYAYLMTRMPATMAALRQVLGQMSHLPIHTFLDLGAGPGTGWLVGSEVFSLKEATCIEAEPMFIELGQELTKAKWEQGDFTKMAFQPHDLVLFSYSIGEVRAWERPLEAAWEATGQALVVVEPGTPENFMRIKQIREKLLSLGAHIAAPCPHNGTCPSQWCHFAARLDRSKLHRLAKEGALGYEDEKFSYLIAMRKPNVSSGSRIVRHPQVRKGHIVFELCTKDGIERRTVVKNDKELYKKARRLQWGDLL